MLDGRAPVGSNEILVGSTTMRRQGIEIGDQVEISGPNGSQTVVVVGRTVVPISGAHRRPTKAWSCHSTRSWPSVAPGPSRTSTSNRWCSPRAAPSDVAAVGREIEGDGAALDGPFRQASVTSLGEVRGIPFYVAGFTAFIGTLAVFHALFVTSRRRRGDLAVLRALGYRPRQAGGVINWQGFFLGLASFVIGCPLGLMVGRLLWTTIATNTNVLPVIDTPWMLIAGFGGLVLVSSTFVLAAGPAWTARRRSPGIDLRAE